MLQIYVIVTMLYYRTYSPPHISHVFATTNSEYNEQKPHMLEQLEQLMADISSVVTDFVTF